MLKRLTVLLAALAAAAVIGPAPAAAAGGDYVFDGGTPRQQAQVRGALGASSFDWSIVPRVTVHIGDYGVSHATPGHVYLDARLLDAGTFAWATVLDEYAHQIDFLLLDNAQRALLQQRLGGTAWCYEVAGLAHGAYGCERFASLVAWAYWESPQNAYRPTSPRDESAAMPAAEFRTLLGSLLGIRAIAPHALRTGSASVVRAPQSVAKQPQAKPLRRR